MKNVILIVALLFLALMLTAGIAAAQSAPFNDTGVTMGHWHINSKDVEANKKLFLAMGGKLFMPGGAPLIMFPGLYINLALAEGKGDGGTVGSVINHVGFIVDNVQRRTAQWKAAGVKVLPGNDNRQDQAFVETPDGVRIEILEDKNQTIAIRNEHIHFFLPESEVPKAQAWYVKTFGGKAGTRNGDATVDLPGVQLRFRKTDSKQAPTIHRILDHIGFDVKDHPAFVKKIQAEGIKLDEAVRKGATGNTLTYITDPWGTRIEIIQRAPLGPEAKASTPEAASAIDASAKAMGTGMLQSVRYTGTGTNNSTGQAYTSGGPWPKYKVTKYTALVNYNTPAMRQEIVRIDNERPPRGGGAGGFVAATGQGGIRPVPGDILQNLNTDGRTEVGALNMWLTPHGFLKGALVNGGAKISGSKGKNKLVSFMAFGKYTVTGSINEQNFVEHVETRIDGGFTGDTLIEGTYSGYKDFGGVKFPTHIVQSQGGFPILDLTVDGVEPNNSTATALELPGNPQRGAGPAAAAQIKSEKIGDGVWAMNYGNERSTAIEFKDYVVIFEAPGGDDQSMATMAEVKRLFPNKPIKYLVNTHHHSDHAGGIRTYAAEGIPIITHESHKRYYEEEIFKAPHTLNPDRLARTPRAPVIETVKDKRVLTDGDMTLEIYQVRGNLHAEGMLMAYVPKDKLLIQADLFVERPGAAPLPAPSPFTTNLVENVERLKLDVQRVEHVHGGIDPWSEILKTAGR